MGQTGQLERQSAAAPLNQLLLSARPRTDTERTEEEKPCKRRFFVHKKRGFILKKYSFEERKRHTIGFS